MSTLWLACVLLLHDAPLEAGDHLLRLTVDDRPRSYRVHVPAQCHASRPAPVVLVFHGTSMNAKSMAQASGLNAKSDEAGFVAVYPNGTGVHPQFLTFNAGEEHDPMSEGRPDDVKFVGKLLDDLAMHLRIDENRVFATGMSNGGMMCYRLAAEMPDRIAAIAPVAGPMAVPMPAARRPLSVIHFHGTADEIVPIDGPDERTPDTVRFRSVDDTLRLWAQANGCPPVPETVAEPDCTNDGTTVQRLTWGPGTKGAEVVFYRIEAGGHTWPGKTPMFKKLLGRSTRDISANDLIWSFFERHPLP